MKVISIPLPSLLFPLGIIPQSPFMFFRKRKNQSFWGSQFRLGSVGLYLAQSRFVSLTSSCWLRFGLHSRFGESATPKPLSVKLLCNLVFAFCILYPCEPQKILPACRQAGADFMRERPKIVASFVIKASENFWVSEA